MRVETCEMTTRERGIRVVLSRRNLETLLAKLDGFPANSECSIEAPRNYGSFQVKAEPDDVHYAHPSRLDPQPGVMHRATEARIRQARDG